MSVDGKNYPYHDMESALLKHHTKSKDKWNCKTGSYQKRWKFYQHTISNITTEVALITRVIKSFTNVNQVDENNLIPQSRKNASLIMKGNPEHHMIKTSRTEEITELHLSKERTRFKVISSSNTLACCQLRS